MNPPQRALPATREDRARHQPDYSEQLLEGDVVEAPPLAESSIGTKRAVLYLRVSTQSQVKTDYDPEGISIPAQRIACHRKAEQMGVCIIDEYVEPGRSATQMDRRPAFQGMLQRIRQERDVDYVIVYKLSRMNRNRVDDALVLMNLRKFSVTLVSATESIDDTPVGQLMHGILAAFNEFRSAEDGADIRYKMGEKARRGGTLGRAPLGYLNIRERFEGREVRAVALDPERAPFIRLAFQLYASGDYTIESLSEELSRRGLISRAGRYPGGPVSASKLQALLRDRYYLGYVKYKGLTFPGRHDPLVEPELFEQVQIILDAKRNSGERQRVHHHYLKGSIWCGRCHDEGAERRMIVACAKGNGGTYFYFFCRGRQERRCDASYVHVDVTENAIARHYGTLRLAPAFADQVRQTLGEVLSDQEGTAKLRNQQLSNQLLKLDRQEENLLDLASEATISKDKLRARLSRIQIQREKLQKDLNDVDTDLKLGADLIEAALKLLADPEELYRQASPDQRRLLNQAFFERLYIDQGEITDHVPAEPFGDLVEAQEVLKTREGAKPVRSEGVASGPTNPFLRIFQVDGSSKRSMVEVSGLEPPTSTLRRLFTGTSANGGEPLRLVSQGLRTLANVCDTWRLHQKCTIETVVEDPSPRSHRIFPACRLASFGRLGLSY